MAKSSQSWTESAHAAHIEPLDCYEPAPCFQEFLDRLLLSAPVEGGCKRIPGFMCSESRDAARAAKTREQSMNFRRCRCSVERDHQFVDNKVERS